MHSTRNHFGRVHAHRERHRNGAGGWLRASVLGANDGLISTSSLVIGVASAHAEPSAIVLTATAGLVAGALSMAAGEYVSVSSQADAEAADLQRERRELATEPEMEREELAAIYVKRGLTAELACEVADQLTAHDALGAHARDELGLTDESRARPLQAALSSALAFALGAALPLVLAAVLPRDSLQLALPPIALGLLAALGALAAKLGGAPFAKAALRVALCGAAALACSALIGHMFGTPV